MARPLRIKFEGAWYHVMNRGANHRIIFDNDQHRELFVELLSEIHTRYKIEIHAYCLMPNHYHLLIRTPQKNISESLRHLNGIYAQRYNIMTQKDGPLFRGRFKSILVQENSYLLELSRYIHLNPVVANLTKEAWDFKWSSARAYLKFVEKPNWLCCDKILNFFSGDDKIKKYARFLKDFDYNDTELDFECTQKPSIMGDKKFIDFVTERYMDIKNTPHEISGQHQLLKGNLPSMKKIINVVAEYYGVSEESIRKPLRRKGNRPRTMAIYLGTQMSALTHSEIQNEFLSLGSSAISRTLKRIKSEIENNRKLQDDLNYFFREVSY